MSVSLSTADYLIIIGYFVAVLVIGFLAVRRDSSASDFLLAGRTLTLPLFVMTLVSTWYGGILGVGEFSYLFGISNWVIQGVPYYIFASVFAFFLAGRVRRTNFVTIPDKLLDAYGRPAAISGAVLTFLLSTPAPYILMLGILLQLITGWSLLVCIIGGTIATTAYLFTGGLRADIQTDVFQFLLMFIGFGVIIPYAYTAFGGLDVIERNVPPLHLTWHGGNSMQFIVVWFLIALWTLVDPAFHQRCYAARSERVARNGILVSILFWFLFDAMTATAGLYARAALPDLQEPMMAFPMLAELTLPSGARGIFFAGMLATIMSSLNTTAFIAATTFGRDILWRVRREEDESRVTAYTRWGLVFTGILSIIVCLAVPSVIRQWYTIGTVIVPGLLVPLVTSYFERLRVPAHIALGSMTLGWMTSSGWLVAGWGVEFGTSEHYPLGIEPMIAGFVASLLVWAYGLMPRART